MSTFVRCCYALTSSRVLSQVNHPSYSSFNELRFMQQEENSALHFYEVKVDAKWSEGVNDSRQDAQFKQLFKVVKHISTHWNIHKVQTYSFSSPNVN